MQKSVSEIIAVLTLLHVLQLATAVYPKYADKLLFFQYSDETKEFLCMP